MAWVKLDDQARHHRKLLAVGPTAAWLWVCGLMYCNTQKARDGFIPSEAVQVLYPIPGWRKEVPKLVAHGLWEVADGGYVVHDYHEYQPTAEDAQALSEKRAAAGRAGGRRSAEARRLAADDGSNRLKVRARADLQLALKSGEVVRQPCAVCGALPVEGHHTDYTRPYDVVWLCKEHHDAEHRSSKLLPKQVKQNEARPDPDPDPDQEITPVGPQGGSVGRQAGGARRTKAGTVKTPWPADFRVSAAIDAMCRAEGLPDPYDVIRDFESSARAKGYVYADWEAAFRKWMRSKITRDSYPVWVPDDAAPDEPQPVYGPPAKPPPELKAKLERLYAPRPLLPFEPKPGESSAGGENVFWTPPAKRAGAGT